MSATPAAFLSYTRFDDEHSGGRISEVRTRIAGEVRAQTGRPFEIFQDRDDISWGQQWQSRINDTLDAVTFLIPVVTPSFFESAACRDEFERFVLREKELGRNDLILPIYYIESDLLADPQQIKTDDIAVNLSQRQYADWREHRFENVDSSNVHKLIASMARQLRDALRRPTREKTSSVKKDYDAEEIKNKRHADERLNHPIDFGSTLPEIAANFKARMDEFNAIDGGTNNKFLDLGAHVYTCVAHSLDFVITASRTSPELRVFLEGISRRLKRLANYEPDYLKKHAFPKYWSDGTDLARELEDHVRHIEKSPF